MIASIVRSVRDWMTQCINAWDVFWFSPRHVETLAILRILTGGMLLYSHLVLATDLGSFLGTEAWINNDTARQLHDGTLGAETDAWSYLWNLESPTAIWVHHLVTLLASAAFMIGFLTRLSGPLAWFLQLMVLHRLLGTLFGLDQIVTYCAMYLAFTPCGAAFSIDAYLRRRNSSTSRRWVAWLLPENRPSVAANVGTRLLQLHLCVIYLFGGLAKARGQMWWDGTALWYAIANYEYQSWDVTFLASYPRFFTALTHLTLLWEIFYCALIWPRWSRPVTLALAVAVHAGIAIFLGMATFGTMMIVANGIFISPTLIRRWRGDSIGSEPISKDLSGSSPHMTNTKRIVIEAAISDGAANELKRRAEDLEKAEKAFKKRYVKLKRREAEVRERSERLKTTKAKIRQKLIDGNLMSSESELELLKPHEADLFDEPESFEDSNLTEDFNLSDPDLLGPSIEIDRE